MPTIESGDYEATRQRLMKDPLVQDMAQELMEVPLSELTHNADPNDPRPTPTFGFMMACNSEYDRRKPDSTGALHIGAVAEVILRLLNDQVENN